MIQIGVRAHDYGRSEPKRLFNRIAQDGFDCVQLAFQKAIVGVKRLDDLTLKTVNCADAEMRKNGLYTAVFGAYVDLALPNEKTNRQNAEILRRCLPYAKRMNARCVGLETTSRDKQSGISSQDALNKLLHWLEWVLPEAESSEVILAIEPVCSHTVNTPECAQKILKEAASPYLKIIFDPCNLLSGNLMNTQRNLWDRTIDCLGENIVSVHFKGRAVGGDGQLIKTSLVNSEVDYPYLFKKLKELPQNLSVLREETDPAFAAQDCRFLKSGLLGD